MASPRSKRIGEGPAAEKDEEIDTDLFFGPDVQKGDGEPPGAAAVQGNAEYHKNHVSRGTAFGSYEYVVRTNLSDYEGGRSL